MDIIQLKGIVEAAMGFKQLNVLPYQLEYEILLIWYQSYQHSMSSFCTSRFTLFFMAHSVECTE
jgi:hypothetical protein